ATQSGRTSDCAMRKIKCIKNEWCDDMILDNKNIQHIHFMGIGGIGVSALAEILMKKGYRITGTDIAPNKNTERLKKLGVEVTFGHENTCVAQADLAVYSSAIAKTNPEFI